MESKEMLWKTRVSVLLLALLWMTHAPLVLRSSAQTNQATAQAVAVNGERLNDALRRIGLSEVVIADLNARQIRIETTMSNIEKLCYGIMVPLAILLVERVLQLVLGRSRNS
jgi:hypothetical protein